MKMYMQLFIMSATNPQEAIPACGMGSVVVLDARFNLDNQIEWCSKMFNEKRQTKPFVGFTIERGSFSASKSVHMHMTRDVKGVKGVPL